MEVARSGIMGSWAPGNTQPFGMTNLFELVDNVTLEEFFLKDVYDMSISDIVVLIYKKDSSFLLSHA